MAENNSLAEKIEWYREVLELEPGSKIFFPLARMLAQENRIDEAVNVLERGLERHEEFLEARLFFIGLLHSNGRAEACEKQISVLSGLFARYGSFWQAWAACFARQGSGDAAIALRLIAAHFISGQLNIGQVLDKGLDAILGGQLANAAGLDAPADAAAMPAVAGQAPMPAEAEAIAGPEAFVEPAPEQSAEADDLAGVEVTAPVPDPEGPAETAPEAEQDAVTGSTEEELPEIEPETQASLESDPEPVAEQVAKQMAEEQPLEEQTGEEQAIEEQAGEDLPIEEQAVEEQPGEEQAGMEVAADLQPEVRAEIAAVADMGEEALKELEAMAEPEEVAEPDEVAEQEAVAEPVAGVEAADETALAEETVSDQEATATAEELAGAGASLEPEPEPVAEQVAEQMAEEQPLEEQAGMEMAADLQPEVQAEIAAVADMGEEALKELEAMAEPMEEATPGPEAIAEPEEQDLPEPDPANDGAIIDSVATVNGAELDAMQEDLGLPEDNATVAVTAGDVAPEAVATEAVAPEETGTAGAEQAETAASAEIDTAELDQAMAEDAMPIEEPEDEIFDPAEAMEAEVQEAVDQEVADAAGQPEAGTDLNVEPVAGATAPARSVYAEQAPAKTRPAVADSLAEPEEGEPFCLRTRSMAAVLAEQGDAAGAIDIYRELLAAAQDPAEKEELKTRIASLAARVSNVPGSQQLAQATSQNHKTKLISMLESLAERVEARAV